MTGIFELIRLLLGLFGLWEQFCNYTDKVRQAEAEARTQRREKGVDAAVAAETPEDAWKAQETIVDNKP